MSLDTNERARTDRSFGYAKADQKRREFATSNEQIETLERKEAGQSLKVVIRRRSGIQADRWQ